MSIADGPFQQALFEHDERVAELGLPIWLGAEPTFTLASAEGREWLSEALGGDKEPLALRLLDRLREEYPGSLILRTVGRQYDKEKRPRWSFGLYSLRDHQNIWNGPSDPLGATHEAPSEGQAERLANALSQAVLALGWSVVGPWEREDAAMALLCRLDGEPVDASIMEDDRIQRPSVNERKTPHDGLEDSLADEGLLLLVVETLQLESGSCLSIELPPLESVGDFLALISAIEEAAGQAGAEHLVLRGYPPPVDESVAWTTVTPDPAVIEVNQAPETSISGFYGTMHSLYQAANGLKLKPWRAHYNGRVTDSGGGGQITLGGPSPLESPFFKSPDLLPRLVRYLNHHPVLSYHFATDYLGAASQSPRPDEAVRDRFQELHLALAQLARKADSDEALAPEFLWASLAPFLADSSGNSHRSELNIEKLWNPYLPGRGELGLVEFRAFRMQHSPERAAALAALLRAICAMLSQTDVCSDLQDWGDALHDRFALPWHLEQDLRCVFTDLDEHEFGLGQAIERELLDAPMKSGWQQEFEGVVLEIRRAVEFWPLVGDTASQESGGSRLVDSSSARLQFSLRATSPDAPDLDGWELRISGHSLPLQRETDEQGSLRLAGVRYREFAPWRGLHPGVQATDPLEFSLSHPKLDQALHAWLHSWNPHGEPYDGLPKDREEAGRRQRERLVTQVVDPLADSSDTAPTGSVTPWTLDLRWL
ncbi:MAG: transglutaminase family protein [Gammaproteobacteria bacterium]